MGAKLGISH